MNIRYSNKEIEKACNDVKYSKKVYGIDMAEKIALRLTQIKAASNIDVLIACRIGRCHALLGDRRNQYAMDLVHPYRLIFTKCKNEIEFIEIIEIGVLAFKSSR